MIEALDYGILEVFQQIQNMFLTHIFKFFTTIGEAGVIWIIAGIFLLIKKESRKYGVIVLLSLLMCLLFGNGLLKNLIARPRPCWRHPEVKMLIGIPKDYSFPSGHTFSSFAGSYSIFYWKKKYGYVAFAMAVMIAASRLYFFVHYPTDIFAGAIFGIFLSMVSIWIVEKGMLRKKRQWK